MAVVIPNKCKENGRSFVSKTPLPGPKKLSETAKTLKEAKRLQAMNLAINSREDSIEFCEGEKSLKLTFNGAATLSHNKILRVEFRLLHSYHKSWYSRVKNLVDRNMDSVSKWLTLVGGNRLLLEGLEIRPTAERDTDSVSGAIKAIVDGLNHAELFKDDDQKHLFVMPLLQARGSSEVVIVKLKPMPNMEGILSPEFSKYL
ncbi:TPA: hypothetical protein I7730_16330 [Vibrio vulnificus]|uniref:Uncharacterized protein n=1 Tax=Vibrio vulnificus TaxID=672 RepID=A0A8H9N202_VIBVL|nr:hypothetical protein [Vibrio vulnificus]